jgi:hypothetical protein
VAERSCVALVRRPASGALDLPADAEGGGTGHSYALRFLPVRLGLRGTACDPLVVRYAEPAGGTIGATSAASCIANAPDACGIDEIKRSMSVRAVVAYSTSLSRAAR